MSGQCQAGAFGTTTTDRCDKLAVTKVTFASDGTELSLCRGHLEAAQDIQHEVLELINAAPSH